MILTSYKNFHSALIDIYSESEIHFLYQYIERENPALLNPNTIELLQKKVPVDYILGYTFFYNLKLQVTPDTLIPRPETEEMVALILSYYKYQKNLKVLDIGTGSGCIAIALAKFLTSADITAIDISEKALEVAKTNAKGNGVDIRFDALDILNQENWDKLSQYDLIVSNPPYIPISEKKILDSNLNYEPQIALYVEDNDPLLFYHTILSFGRAHLQDKGKVYFETHQNIVLESDDRFQIAKMKDMSGNQRFLICTIKS